MILFSDGLDFFYSTESQARKLVDFMSAVLPCRYQQSKKLLSHDIHSNVYNYKFTYRYLLYLLMYCVCYLNIN